MEVCFLVQEVSLVLALETGRPAKALCHQGQGQAQWRTERGLFFYYLILVLRFVVDREDAVPAEKKRKRRGRANETKLGSRASQSGTPNIRLDGASAHFSG